jgi:hypothetical protein
MANLMPGEYNLPATDAAQVEQINRRRQFADALRKQQDPQGQMVSGVYVAPSITQHLATLLNKYQAGSIDRDSDKQIQDIYGNRQKTVQSAQQRLIDALKPKQVQDGETSTMPAYTPEQMDQFGSPLPNVQREPIKTPTYKTVTPGPQDLMQAQLEYAQSIGDPNAINQALQGQIGYQVQQQSREDDRAWRTEQANAAREQRMQEIQMRLQDQRLQSQERAALQRELQQNMIEARKEMATMNNGGGAQPYFQAIPTAQGYARFNARTGQMEPIDLNGGAVLPAAQDPSLQGQLSGAKAAGKVQGETRANAQINYPQVAAEAQNTIKLVDDLLNSKGFKQAVGASRLMGVQNIPGTAAKDFDVRLDQLKGKQFLQAFESLKGGGQITEVEGKKATDAISRMNASSSEAEFRNAAKEFQDIIRTGLQRAQAKAGAPVQQPTAPAAVKRYNPATGRIE